MQIITGKAISDRVDYSFGDHRALWDNSLPDAFMKEASAINLEFITKAKEFEGRIMTLYIDNIRLYTRPLKVEERDKQLINLIMVHNNLLLLCSLLPKNQFIIYTGEEDTPIDKTIVVPWNVKHIYAVNALFNNALITPFPFGLQRKMTPTDERLYTMALNVELDEYIEPTKLLYINMGIGRNPERQPFTSFTTNDWVTTRFDKESRFFPFEQYQDFLNELRDHKFIACPKGHGFDTHRIWESLYLRRVPVMLCHPYFEKLLKGFPILWVDNWINITKELLLTNDNLYQEAQTLDLGKLDLDKIMADNRERFAHQ